MCHYTSNLNAVLSLLDDAIDATQPAPEQATLTALRERIMAADTRLGGILLQAPSIGRELAEQSLRLRQAFEQGLASASHEDVIECAAQLAAGWESLAGPADAAMPAAGPAPEAVRGSGLRGVVGPWPDDTAHDRQPQPAQDTQGKADNVPRRQ